MNELFLAQGYKVQESWVSAERDYSLVHNTLFVFIFIILLLFWILSLSFQTEQLVVVVAFVAAVVDLVVDVVVTVLVAYLL